MKCMEHGLTMGEGALMDLFNQLSSWAEEKMIDGRLYYFISRNKVVAEIPFFFKKPDTVYRAFRTLTDKQLVDWVKVGVKDFIRLMPEGKEWNKYVPKVGNESEFGQKSEMDPNKVGNGSEFVKSANTNDNEVVNNKKSEMDPTYNIYNNTNDSGRTKILKKIQKEDPMKFDLVFGDKQFHQRIMMYLATKNLKADLEKDVFPVMEKWVCSSWAAGTLDSTTSRLKNNLTAYVVKVMETGGLIESKKKEKEFIEPLPPYLRAAI